MNDKAPTWNHIFNYANVELIGYARFIKIVRQTTYKYYCWNGGIFETETDEHTGWVCNNPSSKEPILEFMQEKANSFNNGY